MGSFFELALVAAKSRGGEGAWLSAKEPSLAQYTKDDDTPPSTHSRLSEEAFRTTSTPTLSRLITLFVAEAVSSIEHGSSSDKPPRTGGADTSFTPDQGGGSGTGKPATSNSSNLLWAMWVLDMLLLLESTYGGMEKRITHGHSDDDSGGDFSTGLIGPVMRGEETKSVASEETKSSLGLAVASARSPRAFAAVLRITAIGNSVGEDLRVLACSVCAHMLDLSRLAPTFGRPAYCTDRQEDKALADTTITTTAEYCHHAATPIFEPTKDECALPLQERSLAREFSTRLRTQVSMQSLGSPSLQSQLELLAQWQLRRSTAHRKRNSPSKNGTRTRRLHDDEERPKEGPRSERNRTGTDNKNSAVVPEIWTHSNSDERTDSSSWDVATASFAGVEEASDNSNSDMTQVKKFGIGRPKGSDTAESEASALSAELTAAPGKDNSSAQNMSLFVETASATSVTVSWGGWLDIDHGPELQVGIGSNGIAYPIACGGREAGASDLAQALRSKLSHAASRRREQESGLVLKVKH